MRSPERATPRVAVLLLLACVGVACLSRQPVDGVGFRCNTDSDCKAGQGLSCFQSVCVPDGGPTVVIAAAGNIACDPASFDGGFSPSCAAEQTAELLRGDAGFDVVLPLGNLQREDGTAAKFQQVYMPTWGTPDIYARTRPVAGVREYQVVGAPGLFATFPQLHTLGEEQGYYSFEAGTWHVVVLNTAKGCGATGPACGPGSPQANWLEKDLSDHAAARCTLAVMHSPLLDSGGSDGVAQTFWNILYAHQADVVLAGSNHLYYERFDPSAPDGGADPDGGLRSWVVGTGGVLIARTLPAGPPLPTSHGALLGLGVLRMVLAPGHYSWGFLNAVGTNTTPFTDPGDGVCHRR